MGQVGNQILPECCLKKKKKIQDNEVLLARNYFWCGGWELEDDDDEDLCDDDGLTMVEVDEASALASAADNRSYSWWMAYVNGTKPSHNIGNGHQRWYARTVDGNTYIHVHDMSDINEEERHKGGSGKERKCIPECVDHCVQQLLELTNNHDTEDRIVEILHWWHTYLVEYDHLWHIQQYILLKAVSRYEHVVYQSNQCQRRVAKMQYHNVYHNDDNHHAFLFVCASLLFYTDDEWMNDQTTWRLRVPILRSLAFSLVSAKMVYRAGSDLVANEPALATSLLFINEPLQSNEQTNEWTNESVQKWATPTLPRCNKPKTTTR
jgi:hypothetical protein